MNLLQTIRAIEGVAASQPAVSAIVRNDVYRLNAWPAAKYGTFAWLQNEHTSDQDDDFLHFNFTFFYVDRLTENKGNEVEIQSTGIEVLGNILRELDALNIFPGAHTFRSFNERFSDECAGVFCNVTLDVLKDSLCGWDYYPNTDAVPIWDGDAKVWNWKIGNKEIQVI